MHKTFIASRLVAATVAALTSLLASAQTSTVPVGMSHSGPPAVWRATSRLGYAPTPDQTAALTPRTWALNQIDLAYAASQQAPAIPPELARINSPLGDIARDFQAEREARKVLRTPVAAEGMVRLPAAATAAVAGEQGFSREMAQSAAAWRVMACSDPALENPLLARMTEFWFNHLNVFAGKGNVRPFVGHYAVNVIRAHALGRFEDLLLASARHPAMLYYLDQAQSSNRGLNENYARELMELHTLGVGGGYTQNDVHELARILTGWTVNLRDGEGFRFADRLHDKGDKIFLDRRYTNQGQQEGEDAIRFLARQPATAQRVSERLATFFVADKPPAALVERLRQTFLASQGDMREVMRALVSSPEFWTADNPLFKTPMDFACSALTAGGGVKDRRDIAQTLGFLAQAGQPMHGWPTPDGYKTDAATWLAPEALTRRADFAMGLAARIPDVLYLNAFLSPATQERIAREPARMRTGLILSSPDFMRK
ncbi:hypothetical protein [Polaromonas sp. CG9_12]|nr:hypothetical protein [Polaromonas sp. CG9_12]